MIIALIAVGTMFVAFGLSQIAAVVWEHRRRYINFRAARRYATAVGKPLLVVGRPSGLIRTYSEGDVTLDIDPRVAEECRSGYVADVRQIAFPDKHFGSAFCSHVLEYLPDVVGFEKAVAELNRVAEKVFICYTLPLTIWWRFFSIYQHLWLSEGSNGRLRAQRRPW